jgi:putative Ca2+/H+ antiporter (TMEM165/GDT1 family)
MDLKSFFTIAGTIFLAELGDKTQIATLLYASDAQRSKLTVLLASSLALVTAAALSVIAGAWLSEHVDEKFVRLVAGIGFVAVGVWTLVRA